MIHLSAETLRQKDELMKIDGFNLSYEVRELIRSLYSKLVPQRGKVKNDITNKD